MFFKKHQFPINLFLIFEKVKPIIYSSKNFSPNHYICIIPKKNYLNLNLCLKHELFYNYSFLVDISVIDTLKYNKITSKMDKLFKKSRFLQYNIYYCYFIKTRLTLIQTIKDKTDSIDKVYTNSSWLERETSEMYNLNYTNKSDSRSLLLDYSRNEYPMLKDFPTEGYEEIYFDFFENKVNYIKNEFIEL